MALAAGHNMSSLCPPECVPGLGTGVPNGGHGPGWLFRNRQGTCQTSNLRKQGSLGATVADLGANGVCWNRSWPDVATHEQTCGRINPYFDLYEAGILRLGELGQICSEGSREEFVDFVVGRFGLVADAVDIRVVAELVDDLAAGPAGEFGGGRGGVDDDGFYLCAA